MSDVLQRVQRFARELASSGKFAGWRAVTFELQFEPSLKEAFQWLHDASVEDAFQWIHSPATKAELDRLCNEARSSSPRDNPEAA
jgi:phosphoserine phosphatase